MFEIILAIFFAILFLYGCARFVCFMMNEPWKETKKTVINMIKRNLKKK